MEDPRVTEAAKWICDQLSIWFSEDGRSCARALATALGLVAKDVSGAGAGDDFFDRLAPATLAVLKVLEEKRVARGEAIGALSGAILYLAKPAGARPDEPPREETDGSS